MSSKGNFVAIIVLLSVVGSMAQSSTSNSAMTEAQQRAMYNESSFQYTFSPVQSLAANSFGAIQTLFLNNNPALDSLPNNGLGQTVINLNPCAIWNPHFHPRASEVLYVAMGTVQVGFQEENRVNLTDGSSYGGRLFNFSSVSNGTSIILPQGLTHYIWNPTCAQANLVSGFDNRDPGTQSIAPTLFNLPTTVIAASTGLDATQITAVKALVARQTLVSFDPACLTTCGLTVPSPGSVQSSSTEAPAASATATAPASG